MTTITVDVQSLLNSADTISVVIDDAESVANLKAAVSGIDGTNVAIMRYAYTGEILQDANAISSYGITTNSFIQSANIIGELPTREQRQLAKLELAALRRQAAGNTVQPYYRPQNVADVSLLPARYSGNVVVDNPNPGGLYDGRPWTINVVTQNLQLYLNASNPKSYSGSGTTWTDLSTNEYATTLIGAPAYNITHFTFDGEDDYVDTNQSLSSESFSVGAWFRSTATGINMILSKEEAAGKPWNYRLFLNAGELTADIGQGVEAVELTDNDGYNDGEWYFGMFTRDDDEWHLYVNGVEVATRSDPLTGTVANSQELWIGRSAFTSGGTNPTGSYPYNGDIGQVFIYNAVLTPAEVLQNYTATRATYGL